MWRETSASGCRCRRESALLSGRPNMKALSQNPQAIRSRRYYASNKERAYAATRSWSARHPEKVKAAAKRARAKTRAHFRKVVDRLKRMRGCVDCGERDPIVLQFDHVTGAKKGSVSKFLSSRTALVRELAKCQIRCANCHVRVSFIRGQFG